MTPPFRRRSAARTPCCSGPRPGRRSRPAPRPTNPTRTTCSTGRAPVASRRRTCGPGSAAPRPTPGSGRRSRWRARH
ncbi:hypothetical protein SSAG_05774 [Streptomyces sp. Mg1]|nr:hypothetical protein SSAG_05774 [Streptomyces sp. Mg1]